MYTQITFFCEQKQAKALSEFLSEADTLAVSLMDAADEPIFEPKPGETPLWSEVRVIALFANERSAHATLSLLKELLGDIIPYQIETIQERDWVSETQAQFQPLCIAEKFWIYPEWQEVLHHQPVLKLAPGLAFGTGAHETTRICLEALAKFVQPGNIIIDFGCGSGILGCAALLLGAKKAYFIDIDPQALEATERNIFLNQFPPEKFFIGLPDALPKVHADILVANILANPLIELKPAFEKLLNPEGKIILAGLLENQAEEVTRCYHPWRKLVRFKQAGEWVCLWAKISPAP